MIAQSLTLGHSPDSDDAFMFYGLSSGNVATDGLSYEHMLKDIQTLNGWAKEGRLDITAISVHAYAYVGDKYAILQCGASMGEKDYGPLVVGRAPVLPDQLKGATIAVPGLMTSAYLALRLAIGEFVPLVVPFDAIMDAVAEGRPEYGLLIHEGQLTHQEMGFFSILNLGTWWFEQTMLPLPLGVNAIRRTLPDDVKKMAARHLRESIEYGLDHREAALAWALRYARGMSTRTADAFVGMYVNQRTLDLGEEGRRSVELFLRRGADAGLVPSVSAIDYVTMI